MLVEILMASRADVFLNNNIYHIFNKTLDKKTIFNEPPISEYFLKLICYYRSNKARIRYSFYKRLPDDLKILMNKELSLEKNFRIEILAYCLMPNHFHLLIRQKEDDGIVKTVSNTLNALTRYYNLLNNRKGPVFLPQFRSRVVLTREQLLHVSRYIHLNPYSSGIVKTTDQLENYELSSFKEYVLKKARVCNTRAVLEQMNNNKESYKTFVLRNAEYQKMLEHCKYAEKWY